MDAPVDEYESLCMVATGFGMAALLPYLKTIDSRLPKSKGLHASDLCNLAS